MSKNKGNNTDSVLSSIDEMLKKQNSLKRIFIQGLVRGFGTAIGATVMLAIATSLTFKLIDSINTNTFSEYFVNNLVD